MMTSTNVFYVNRYGGNGNNEEIAKGPEKMLRLAESSEQLKISWCRTCADVFLLLFTEREYEEYERVG